MNNDARLKAAALLGFATISAAQAADGQQVAQSFQRRPSNEGRPPQAGPGQAAEQQRAQQGAQAQQQHVQQEQAMQQQRAQQEQAAQQQRAQQEQAAQQQRAQQAQVQQQRAQQEQAQQQKAQQEQVMQAHQQQLKAQEEARQAEEQRVSAQEQQARNAQMQALRAQNEQAAKAREIEQRQTAPIERNNQRNQPEPIREQVQPTMGTAPGAEINRRREEPNARVPNPAEQRQGQPPFAGTGLNPASRHGRTVTPPPLQASVVPIQKALSMPVLQAGVSAQDKQHAQTVNHNLEKHLIAVQGAQAPANRMTMRTEAANHYFNNYHTVINNHPININRQNTNYFQVPAHQYPHWYQQEPGWVYSNGFSLGDSIRVGPDWLRWGWHPYFGPPPDGFVCATDYIPTPWIYVPAYGLWREPGVNAYSESGPPYDYDGPISVEVLEPRHVQTRDPYTGWNNDQIINVVYLYNAFYYPDFGRYGYMNRYGYFIWLDFDGND